MAYDEHLADRIRQALAAIRRVEERTMFGGLAFMIDGKMAVGVLGKELMVRVGSEAHEAALAQPGARPMDFTGRPMRGFVFVGPTGSRSQKHLTAWVTRALEFNRVAPSRARSKTRSQRRTRGG